MRINVIKKKMTQEESDQMTGMFNWANDADAISMINLKMFKQYNIKDKHYHTVFEVESMHWINNMHKTVRGTGSTVIDAMKEYSKRLRKI